MKRALKSYKWQTLFILCLIIHLTKCEENYKNSGEKLSRRKRYLSFPEGSSLQVIYDQTIPVVALPLVFTVGVTCAIAYELPSNPFSELIEDFTKRFEVLKNNNSKIDNINQISYVAKDAIWKDRFKGVNRHDLYYTDKQSIQSKIKNKEKQWNYPQNIYYENNKPNPWTTSDKFSYAFGPKFTNYGNEGNKFNYVKSLANQYTTPALYNATRRKDSLGNLRSFSKKIPHRKHIIQPVFGKRSVDDHDELHKVYHITTRQLLYKSIEKYLEKNGLTGKECVLKTLCESRANKNLPNSFMGTIFQTIFRLPQLNLLGEYDGKDYMRAHHNVEDCEQTYSNCKGSFWATDFVK